MPEIGLALKIAAAGYMAAAVVTFLAFALDKRVARLGASRIRERTLHILELAGGWPGAILAQFVLRHKNRKPTFFLVTWLIAAAHLLAWSWIVTR